MGGARGVKHTQTCKIHVSYYIDQTMKSTPQKANDILLILAIVIEFCKSDYTLYYLTHTHVI